MSSQRFSTVSYLKVFLNEFASQIHYLVMLVAIISVFAIDLASPLDVAAGTLYALVVFGSLFIKGNISTYVAAVMGLIFAVAGFFLSASMISPLEAAIINQLLETLLIVGAALIVIRIKKADENISALRIQSIIDPLTQAKNYRAFEQELSREILLHKRHNKNLSVAFIDIDYLHKINQSYGNDGGDNVINQVAKEIESNIRSSDVLYRLAGDKFAILFAETSMLGTKSVGEAICKKTSSKIALSDRNITLSMGIATLEEKDSKRSLCQRVEKALLQSKADGGNRVTTVPPVSTKDAPRIAAILARSRY